MFQEDTHVHKQISVYSMYTRDTGLHAQALHVYYNSVFKPALPLRPRRNESAPWTESEHRSDECRRLGSCGEASGDYKNNLIKQTTLLKLPLFPGFTVVPFNRIG